MISFYSANHMETKHSAFTMLYLDVLNRRNAFSGNLNVKGQTTCSKFGNVLIPAYIFFAYSRHRKIPSLNLRLEDTEKYILTLKCEI